MVSTRSKGAGAVSVDGSSGSARAPRKSVSKAADSATAKSRNASHDSIEDKKSASTRGRKIRASTTDDSLKEKESDAQSRVQPVSEYAAAPTRRTRRAVAHTDKDEAPAPVGVGGKRKTRNDGDTNSASAPHEVISPSKRRKTAAKASDAPAPSVPSTDAASDDEAPEDVSFAAGKAAAVSRVDLERSARDVHADERKKKRVLVAERDRRQNEEKKGRLSMSILKALARSPKMQGAGQRAVGAKDLVTVDMSENDSFGMGSSIPDELAKANNDVRRVGGMEVAVLDRFVEKRAHPVSTDAARFLQRRLYGGAVKRVDAVRFMAQKQRSSVGAPSQRFVCKR